MKLIIVESPAKAKKIQTFFPKNVIVRSSFGHINGLDTTKLDKMIDNNFNPIYKISNPKIVQELKNIKYNDVVLAADDDRESLDNDSTSLNLEELHLFYNETYSELHCTRYSYPLFAYQFPKSKSHPLDL